MTVHAWIALAMTGLILVGLIRDHAPEVLFLGASVILAIVGVISPTEAFAGFSNAGILTVGGLFAVAAGLRETGVMDYVGDRIFGRAQTETAALLRLTLILIPASALTNNTSLVAMLMPVVMAWCRRRQISPSRLLIPLAFLTHLGGVCTMIGTSTNLVIQGLLIQQTKLRPLSFLEPGYVGLPCAVVGTVYLLTIGRRLLPDRKELIEQLGQSRREYLVEMRVQAGSRLVGQSVAVAGLRQLPGLFLIEVDRQGEVIGPVGPDEVIRADDRLVFTGVVSTIVDLEKIPGLVPVADPTYEVSPRRRRGRQLCEVVISPTSPLVGQSIRNANFRALYDAAVVAVHRHGARVTNKVGDVSLRPGDTLLLQAGHDFRKSYRNSPDFYLVSDVEDSRPLRQDRARIATVIFVAMVAAMCLQLTEPVLAVFLAAGLMVATRCISATVARRAVQWPVMIAIAASFGLGAALENSGAAQTFAGLIVGATRPFGPKATLAAIYFGTMVGTELIGHHAAAVLAFPFCLETARILQVNERPFIIAVALAAANAYASPISHQTQMMVYGPGGYRFTDFARVGLPLKFLLWIIAVALIPIFWPF